MTKEAYKSIKKIIKKRTEHKHNILASRHFGRICFII